MTSPQPTSSIEPSEATALKPVCSRSAQSRTAVTSAPDWLTKPTLPGRAMPFAKVALNPATGFMIPRQFGPTIRIPLARAVSRMRPSSARPSGPVSLNPAEMMIAARTPTAAHSSISAGTPGAGVTITASSTGSGTSAMLG